LSKEKKKKTLTKPIPTTTTDGFILNKTQNIKNRGEEMLPKRWDFKQKGARKSAKKLSLR